MQLFLSNSAQDTLAASLQVANDTEVSALDLSQVSAIALHFPKFTDGRATLRRTTCACAPALVAH